jgi:hypothetical protein
MQVVASCSRSCILLSVVAGQLPEARTDTVNSCSKSYRVECQQTMTLNHNNDNLSSESRLITRIAQASHDNPIFLTSYSHIFLQPLHAFGVWKEVCLSVTVASLVTPPAAAATKTLGQTQIKWLGEAYMSRRYLEPGLWPSCRYSSFCMRARLHISYSTQYSNRT